MFIDLAMLEAELASLNGVRAGQKSRDKKATCPTCGKSGGANPALAHHMYTALTPELYGDDLNGQLQGTQNECQALKLWNVKLAKNLRRWREQCRLMELHLNL